MVRHAIAAAGAALILSTAGTAVSAQDTVRLSQTARVGATTPPTRNQLSDANILAIMAVRNTSEIEAGLIAIERGSSPAVRQYGMMLVRDHRKAMAENQALARRLRITPESPSAYAAPAPPTDASEIIARRAVHAEEVNAAAKAQDPKAEAKSYKDQVHGTDVQAKEAMPAKAPPPEIVHEPRPAGAAMQLKWMPGDQTEMRLAGDPVAAAHVAAMTRLQGLSGPEFDRAFLEYAIIAHEGVLNEVQATLLPDADSPGVKAMLEKKPIGLINHRKAAEKLWSW